MKRVALILIAITGSLALKAQNSTLTMNPIIGKDNSVITFNTPIMRVNTVNGKAVNYKDTTFKVSPYINQSNITLNELLNTTATVNPDRMPIAKPTNTDPRMPIVKTDKTTYNMPIVGNGKVKAYSNYKTKSGADSVVVVK
jgi:hypothetical protein